ncbi:hypothetical protein H5410_045889 [Solanum commersonii]|uniref:Uncharacterized protein n=1 Tax=Solanum commersonii TaxID=4109 RepID=A0A9J5XCX9_SOLCO|nr:hypothetical protein H5410_045889 [Solanum commersonii]
MDVYVSLRFQHGGKLQKKPRIKYEGVKNGDIVELYVTHLVEEAVVPPAPPPEIGYLNDVGGESNASFDKESSQTFEGSEGLGFEEAAQPQEPIVGEDLGEVLGRASASVGEDLGRASVSVGEDVGGTSSTDAAFDIPKVGSDWESETEASDDSDNAYLSDEGEDEYGSDVHEEGKIVGDEPYFDSDEAVSFEKDTDEDVNEEDEVEQPIRRQRKATRAKRNKKKVVFDPSCQLIVWETGLAFESVKQFREAITRYAVQEHVELDKYLMKQLGLCHANGHNKRGCHLNSQANAYIGKGRGRGREISSTRSSVGSFTTQTESQSSTKRGRGRTRGSTKHASATGRRRGTTTSNGTGIGVAADGSGAIGRGKGIGTDLAGRGRGTGVAGRGRGTGVAATATNVPDAIGGGKRPRMVAMGIPHTQSGFTIHNLCCLNYLHTFQS